MSFVSIHSISTIHSHFFVQTHSNATWKPMGQIGFTASDRLPPPTRGSATMSRNRKHQRRHQMLSRERGGSWLSLVATTILLFSWVSTCWMVTAFRPLMDPSGKLHTVPGNINNSGIVSVVTSPGMPATIALVQEETTSESTANTAAPLGLMEDRYQEDGSSTLVCQGASLGTISASDEVTSTCLSLCGAVSECMILEGITLGDVDGSILNSRHARTLAALFRVRLALVKEQSQRPQTLILVVANNSDDDDVSSAGNNTSSFYDKERLDQDIEVLFRAAALEQNEKEAKLANYFDMRVVMKPNGSEVLSMAHEAAKAAFIATEPPQPLAQTLQTTLRQIRDAGLATAAGLDAAQTAQAFVAVLNSNMQLSAKVRSKGKAWKNRIRRGLLIDGFGQQASTLRSTVLSTYDHHTLQAAGLTHVAPHRHELRMQLQQLVDTTIQQAYEGQIANLENLSLKRFQAELLKTVNSKDSTETIMDANAASLRKQALIFETIADDLQVPELGLSKDKAVRDLTPKLNDALQDFPDSAMAKLKRAKRTQRIIHQRRKKSPGKRSMDVGVDLVAMLRPDGFGNLQGFAMYQLPGGHSLTFGVQNDADEPSVIAQFGGIRPPLLRFQPKLRFDVEL